MSGTVSTVKGGLVGVQIVKALLVKFRVWN